ncbi:MAG: hypothetical protein H7Z75_05750 [Ferruginibacter sp.]|nr:hypothetical protein [Cytophagales bacterium]
MENRENGENPPNEPGTRRSFREDFNRGYANGLGNLDRSAYESFLASHTSLETCEQRIAAIKGELHTLELDLRRTQSETKGAFDSLQEHTHQHNLKTNRARRLQADLEIIGREQIQCQETRSRVRSQYSLVAGLLYLAAGIVFMAGDLVISHEIVAYALNIRNNLEAWAFAIGLAALSVLFKPAYERLLEIPYVEHGSDRARRRYVWFKSLLLVFAVGTLFVLGWFRYEAYKTDKLKEGINKAVRGLQTDAAPDALQKMEQQLQTIATLNQQLVNSPWATASFVLTGILFAIAGAVCLGIAFPILQAYWHRWCQLDWRLGRLKRQRSGGEKLLERLEEEISQHQTRMTICQQDLSSLVSLSALEVQRQALRSDLEKLYDDRKFAETDCRIASFNDGYERGAVRASGNPFLDATDESDYADGRETKAPPPPPERSAGEAETRKMPLHRSKLETRPYLAIRKIIASQFENDHLQ